MKKLIAVLIAALASAWALAGSAFGAGPTAGPVNMVAGTALTADLNGSGTEESFVWSYRPDEYDDNYLWLEVTDADGTTAICPTRIAEPVALWLTSFDGPALVVTGYGIDEEAYTYVLRYTADDVIQEVMFSADGRGRLPEYYYTPFGTGIIAQMTDGQITLEYPADVLGTWTARRTYLLNEKDRFVFDDSLWENTADLASEDTWESQGITTIEDMRYTNEEDMTVTLPEGTQLLITASDKESVAQFVTRDGVIGTLDIERGDPTDDFIIAINGISEDQLFENLPYIS